MGKLKSGTIRKPRKVSIGGVEYKIIYQPKITRQCLSGEVDFAKRIVRICNTLPIDNLKSSLLHELLHICMVDCVGIINKNSLNDEDTEEAIVRHLEKAQFQMFRDNPRITRFLFSKE